MEGLSATLLEPGCNLTALSLGKTPAGFWHEDFTLLASALANPASPVKKIQLHGPWSRENVIPFLTAAGHDNSLLKELDFSGVSNERRTFVLAIQDLVTPLAQRGITITLPD